LDLVFLIPGSDYGLAPASQAVVNHSVLYDDEGAARMQEIVNYLVLYRIICVWGGPRRGSAGEGNACLLDPWIFGQEANRGQNRNFVVSEPVSAGGIGDASLKVPGSYRTISRL